MNRPVPNGTQGGVRGGRKFLLLDFHFFQKPIDNIPHLWYNYSVNKRDHEAEKTHRAKPGRKE